jgi:hypothetical protein
LNYFAFCLLKFVVASPPFKAFSLIDSAHQDVNNRRMKVHHVGLKPSKRAA